MRKRSGAIHSDNQLQFLILSEQSLNKTGIFYNEPQNPEQQKKNPISPYNKTSRSQQKINHFKGFQFNQITQYEQDERNLSLTLNSKKPTIVKQFLIICDVIESVVKQIGNYNNDDTYYANQHIDYVLRRLENQDKKQIKKYWVIDIAKLNCPIIDVYLRIVDCIYWISKEQCTVSNAIICKDNRLYQTIQQNQRIFVEN